MKIKLTQTIEIDPQAWAVEYGIDEKQVRDHVREYFRHHCQYQVEALGLEPDDEAYASAGGVA